MVRWSLCWSKLSRSFHHLGRNVLAMSLNQGESRTSPAAASSETTKLQTLTTRSHLTREIPPDRQARASSFPFLCNLVMDYGDVTQRMRSSHKTSLQSVKVLRVYKPQAGWFSNNLNPNNLISSTGSRYSLPKRGWSWSFDINFMSSTSFSFNLVSKSPVQQKTIKHCCYNHLFFLLDFFLYFCTSSRKHSLKNTCTFDG